MTSPTRGAATPGPWETTKDLGQAVVRARGVMVADCNIFGRNAPSEAQCAANARLIACAPDLRDALAGLLALCEASLSPDSDAVRGPLAAARLALQKAEASRG